MTEILILLSHCISENTPLYGGQGKISISRDKNISKGDSCNTFTIAFQNHSGTHIDCPYHFDKEGKKTCDYTISDFIFEKPVIVEIKKNVGELIMPSDFEKKTLTKKCQKADLILIKTGFEKNRGTEEYFFKNPGVSAEAIRYIRSNFDNVRAIGIDAISISSFMHREEGRRAHCAALKERPEILLIEDMCLSKVNSSIKLRKVYCIPLLINEVDSAPVTIFAEKKTKSKSIQD